MHVNRYFHLIAAMMTIGHSGVALSKKTAVPSKNNSEQIAVIGKIDGESSDKLSIATIRMNRKPEILLPKIEAHDSFLQVRIPKTMTPEPGVFYDLKGPWLKKAVVLQADETVSVVRFFVNGDSNTILKAAELDLLNKRLILSVSHKYLDSLYADQTDKVDSEKDSKLVNTPVVSQGEKDKSILPIKDSLKDPFTKNAELIGAGSAGGSGSFNMNSYLIKLTWVSVGVLILTLFLLSLRRILRNRKILTTGTSSVTMKTINDLVLAPRQKLSVVQVGTERLLLSVSPERISLISHMDELRKNETTVTTKENTEGYRDVQPSIRLNRLLKNHRQRIPSAPGVADPIAKTPPKTPQKNSNKKNPRKTRQAQAASAPGLATGVQYRVDDDGIHKGERSPAGQGGVLSGTEKAIDDVTQLIREKLKSLPKL